MAKTVKMSDMSKEIAARVFQMLNRGKIKIVKTNDVYGFIIVTDTEPWNLIYPEGWYYAKGTFRNKHTCSHGLYQEVFMETSDGMDWYRLARYSTL